MENSQVFYPGSSSQVNDVDRKTGCRTLFPRSRQRRRGPERVSDLPAGARPLEQNSPALLLLCVVKHGARDHVAEVRPRGTLLNSTRRPWFSKGRGLLFADLSSLPSPFGEPTSKRQLQRPRAKRTASRRHRDVTASPAQWQEARPPAEEDLPT